MNSPTSRRAISLSLSRSLFTLALACALDRLREFSAAAATCVHITRPWSSFHAGGGAVARGQECQGLLINVASIFLYFFFPLKYARAREMARVCNVGSRGGIRSGSCAGWAEFLPGEEGVRELAREGSCWWL